MELIEIQEEAAGALIRAPEVGMGYQRGILVASDGQARTLFPKTRPICLGTRRRVISASYCCSNRRSPRGGSRPVLYPAP